MTCPSVPLPPDRRERWLRALRIGCRFLLAAVFLMAALTKITDVSAFEDQVVRHGHLPSWFETPVIHALPWLELTCGTCLALGYARREAAVVLTVLLAAFLVHALFNYAERDCGCFLFPSLLPPGQPWWLPVRNLILLAASIVVWAFRCNPKPTMKT